MHANNTLSHSEVQQESLRIFKTISSLCDELELTYFLAYGSLIGAIRHGGFIPWDDDLDIAMPRYDYEVLLHYFDTHQAELTPLIVVRNSSVRKLPFLIARVSDSSYKELGEFSYDAPELGAFIDIYPLDGLGNSPQEAIAEKRRCWRLIAKYLAAGNFKANNVKAGKPKRFLKTIRSKLMRPCEVYEKKILQEASPAVYEASSFVGCKVWGTDQTKTLIVKKTDLGTGVPAVFEGMRVRVPEGYDTILRDQYGDYMTLPPVEERIAHHNYSLVKRSSD